MSLLKIKNLTKVYGHKDTQCIALSDVSFTVNKGELVAICGTSGCGKTTLLNILCGLDSDYKGTVICNDINLNTLNKDKLAILRRKEIGVIYQFFNLVSSLTVEENITLCSELDHQKVDKNKLDYLLEYLEIKNKRNAFPKELSGGQQQRVAIARTLYTRPTLILADEPTGNLDSVNAQLIMDIFKDCVKTYQQTLLIVTHDETIAKQCDRIITLKDGRIISDEKN